MSEITLTQREAQCLQLVAQGCRVATIAHHLQIAPVTVELHLKRVRAKLEARTLPHAVARGIASGLIGVELQGEGAMVAAA